MIDFELMVMASCVNKYNSFTHGSSRVVDSGALFHVTSDWKLFTIYKSGNFELVKMSNHDKYKVVGIENRLIWVIH